MKIRTAKICWWILAAGVVLTWGEVSGLIIYRFGGESLPLPAEVGQEGVKFVQQSWTDADPAQGGEVFELDMDDMAIGALEHDPQVNIAPTVEERGGSLYRGEVNGMVFDGDLNTVWHSERYLCAEFRGSVGTRCYDDFAAPGTANIILGGEFLIDRIRVVSGLENPAGVARNFRLHLNSTLPRLAHHPAPFSPTIVEVRDNREPYRDVPISAHQKAVFLQFQLSEHNEVWDVAEVEVYARGFVDKSTYVSNILDLGDAAAWGEFRWSGRRDPGAKVFIQTRSGADDDPSLYWKFTGTGDEKTEVTRAQYEQFKVGEQAGTTYDRDHWTFWSAAYDFADSLGTPVVSLSPRRYLQFKVDFLPEGDAGGQVEFVELRASVPPAASALVGEIDPVQVEVGRETPFTYALQPTIEGDATGFDRLEMRTSGVVVSVDSVRIADAEVAFAVEAQEDHRFEVSFPRVDSRYTGLLVEVVFTARVLRYGSAFDARVFDSTRPLEVHQGVNPGDAAFEFEGDRVTVATAVEHQSLLEAQVQPGTFTPNGDGVNDHARLYYNLFEITGAVSVQVEIRDLAGRLVRQVHAGEESIGLHQRRWAGRDQAGELVPPGVYLYRVSVEADEGKADRVGTVRVVY